MSEEPRIILHIGASKCGSTALQTTLVRQPEFAARDGRRYEYVAIDRRGVLLRKDALARRAEMSLMGTIASPDVESSEKIEAFLMPAIPALRAMIGDGITPILSSEGWGRKAEVFARSGFVEQLGARARAILFVRPPIDWVNSAWWQWGVWTGLDLDAYVRRQAANLRWPRLVSSWRKVPGVARVDVGLATSDVPARFFGFLGADAPAKVESNAGLPPAFLLFLMRNRTYRPDAHTPKTEFVVARHLPSGRYPTPWVLNHEQIAHIDEALGNSTAKLRGMLAPEDQAAMDSDPRWGGAKAYAGRMIDDLTRYQSPEALADLIGLLRAGLGGNHEEARAAAAARLADSGAPLKAADAMIAKAVDAMHARLQNQTNRKNGLLRGLAR